MAIKCGHCRKYHQRVDEVKLCSQKRNGRPAGKPPSRYVKREPIWDEDIVPFTSSNVGWGSQADFNVDDLECSDPYFRGPEWDDF